jgi:hypothetical protein
MTATEDQGTTTVITKERKARSVRRGVVPTAVEADRGHHTSIRGLAERQDEQKSTIIQSIAEHESSEHFTAKSSR